MSSLWVLAFAQIEFAWKAVKKYKTSQNSHLSSHNVFNTSNFRAIFLWLFTFPGHCQMARLQKMIKWVLPIQIRFRQMLWVVWAKGYTWEKTIFTFLVRPVVTLQLLVWMSTKIFKSQYFDFYSFDLETEANSGNLSIERIHGEKPIFIFLVFHLWKCLWLFNFP